MFQKKNSDAQECDGGTDPAQQKDNSFVVKEEKKNHCLLNAIMARQEEENAFSEKSLVQETLVKTLEEEFLSMKCREGKQLGWFLETTTPSIAANKTKMDSCYFIFFSSIFPISLGCNSNFSHCTNADFSTLLNGLRVL